MASRLPRYISSWMNQNGEFPSSHRNASRSRLNATAHCSENSASCKTSPNFAYLSARLRTECCADLLYELGKENTARIATITDDFMVFLPLKASQWIFTVALRMRLPPEVRCRAAFLFEKYISTQVKSVYGFVSNSECSSAEKEEQWNSIEANMARQNLLRMSCCIQIASKLTDYHSSLDIVNVANALKTFGFPYTKDAILQSELRILKTVDFKVPQSPLVYAEAVLGCLVMKESFKSLGVDVDAVWENIIVYLEVLVMNHEEFYAHLLEMCIGNNNYGGMDLARVKADWMLSAAILVGSSIAMAHSKEACDVVIPDISTICGIPKPDVTDGCICIIKFVLAKSGHLRLPNVTMLQELSAKMGTRPTESTTRRTAPTKS